MKRLAVFAVLAAGAGGCAAPAARGASAWDTDARLHATLEARLGHAAGDSRWHAPAGTTLTDFAAGVRPIATAENPSGWRLQAELQVDAFSGDTIARSRAASLANPPAAADLFDLTRTWSAGPRHRHTARLDRFAATWTRPWGSVTVGRQAVTWGGGLVFNPFDLFNPFAPADVIRDYKVGADMLHVDLPLRDGGLQFLAVGRRATLPGERDADVSSLAALWQRHVGALDVSLLSAWHYDEPVLGAGVGGYLGGATWRIDSTWVRMRPPGLERVRDYAAAVANLQYSWVWGGRNVYGFLEYHFNGLGRTDYAPPLQDPFLGAQLARGNGFVLGRHYAAASLQVELHPLVNLFVSAIVNLRDPSAILQPRVTWDAGEHLQVIAGVDLPAGARGTEFGGFDPRDGGGTTRAPRSFYVRAAWDF